MRAAIVAGAILVSAAPRAWATYASLDARAGAGFSSQALNAGGDLGAAETNEPSDVWNWTAGGSHARTTQDDVAADTLNGRVGLGWTSASRWNLFAQGQYGTIAAENLVQRGVAGGLAYEYDGDRLHPDAWARVAVTAGEVQFDQSYAGTKAGRKGKSIPVHGDIGLEQNSIGLDVSGSWTADWSFDAAVTGYGYGRNLNALYANLATPAALRRGVAGFGNTIGGFPRASITFGLTWYGGRRWQVAGTQTFSNLAVEGQNSRSTEVLVGYNLTRRTRLSLGLERDLSPNFNATLGALILRRRF